MPVTVVMGDDSDSDEILMSEDATNWRSVGKSVNPLAEIAKITKGRTPRTTQDRKPILGNSTNTAAVTPAGTASTIPARPAFTPAAAPAASVASAAPARTPAPNPAASVAAQNFGVDDDRDDDDDEVEVTGASAFRGALNDYPHARHLCQSLPLDKDHPHRASCPMCYCFVCEVPAPCDEWGDGAAPDADHCRAVDGVPRWVSARDARRRARNARANGVRAAGADDIPDYFARRPRPAVDGKGGALNDVDADADADEGGGGGGGLEGDRVGFAGAAFGAAFFPEPERPEDVAAQTENLNEILAGLEDQEKAERDEIDPPPGALRVSLLRHQRRALAWALKRENGAEARGGHCRGGILADDQGLGKTVSMLALIVSAPPPETGANANGVARHVICNRRDLGGRPRAAVGVRPGGRPRSAPPARRGGRRDAAATDDDERRRGASPAVVLRLPAAAADPDDGPAHLPSCVCPACKRRRKERRRSLADAERKRRATIAFGDSDDEDAVAARERHERREALRRERERRERREAGGRGTRGEEGPAGDSVSGRRGRERIGGVGPARTPARTLIVCPAIVAQQWKDEVDEKTDLRCVIYHGSARRHLDERTLLAHDVVITTYGTVTGEFTKGGDSPGALFNVAWWRVILDEAHIIRNRRTMGSVATCALQASRRWCLSGTPLMNGVDDAFALFRFLRYQPFACWPHFNNHISRPSASRRGVEARVGALASLRIALAAVCLRRVKSQQIETDVPGKFEPIVDLPPRTVAIREIDFDEAEKDFYRALEERTVTMFDTYVKRGWKANYMHILVLLLKLRQACDHPLLLKEAREQNDRDGVRTLTRDELLGALGADRVRALEKDIEDETNCPICMDAIEGDKCTTSPCGHGPFCRDCLVISLNAQVVGDGDKGACPLCRHEVDPEDGVLSLKSLVDALEALDVNVERDARMDQARQEIQRAIHDFAELGHGRGRGRRPVDAAARQFFAAVDANGGVGPGVSQADEDEKEEEEEEEVLDIADSAKTRAILDELATIRAEARPGTPPEQCVVFSQFTKFLDIIGPKIEDAGHAVLRLDGTQRLSQRAQVVAKFRRGEAGVLLVSLKAASLGLNLNCASRVILTDPWWNAAIEDQAIDRCHRIGQTREVKVVRLLIRDTVENRIRDLQERKKAIVAAALGKTGESIAAIRQQLSLRDLQDLFGRVRRVEPFEPVPVPAGGTAGGGAAGGGIEPGAADDVGSEAWRLREERRRR